MVNFNVVTSLLLLGSADSFMLTKYERTVQTSIQMCPGGWGIGTPLDMQEEEFSKGTTQRRRRRRKNSSSSGADDVAYGAERAEAAANRYALQDRAQFAQKVAQEKDTLRMQKKQDLLEIAKMAGLADRLKPKANVESGAGKMEKFDDEFLDDFGEDDSLDVRVY
jgi:hypothetical protein